MLKLNWKTLRWPRVLILALMIAVAPTALICLYFRVDPEFHELWMLLSRARTLATMARPVTVRFTDWGAVMEDRRGAVLDTLFLATLAEVRYRTTQGDRRIVFSPGGPTSPYNLHLHGGDITLRAWTGRERSLWVHCTGGITGGRNDDWTPNRR